MNAGNIESNNSVISVGKLNQLAGYLFVIEVGILVAANSLDLRQTRVGLEFVVIAKIILVDDLVNKLTAITAKYLLFNGNPLA